MAKKPKTSELVTEPEVTEPLTEPGGPVEPSPIKTEPTKPEPTDEELELAELVEKCLNEHGDPKDGATHGELERIRYLVSVTKKK